MEIIKENTSKICRLCLAECIVYRSLLNDDRAIYLEALTAIKVDKGDATPTVACIKCYYSLKYAYHIQQNILEADHKLRLLHINLSEDIDDDPNEDFVDQQEESIDGSNHHTTDFSNYFKTKGELDVDESIEPIEFAELKVEAIAPSDELNEQLFIETENYSNSNEINEYMVDIQEEHLVKDHCKICGLDLYQNEFLKHMKDHFFSTIKCDECNMPCENIHSYRQHLVNEHKEVNLEKNWICKTCGVSFSYKPLYIIHFKSAHPVKIDVPSNVPGIYPCSYCKKKFFSEKKRDTHALTHKKKQCEICGAHITPSNFPAHRKSHLVQNVECPICKKKYKNTISLKGHLHYTHSKRTYLCEFCEKTFKKSYTLLLHIKREHTGEKSHVCDICGKAFLTFFHMSKHKRMTHQKLRPHLCEYCHKLFSSKFALRTHKRVHTLDAPYECDLCPKNFRQKVSLRSHKKTVHNIEEALTVACEVCGKKFSNKFAVMSHMRLH